MFIGFLLPELHGKKTGREKIADFCRVVVEYVLNMGCPKISGWLRNRTGTVGTVLPGTGSGTGTAGTVFQEPKPEPEPSFLAKLY